MRSEQMLAYPDRVAFHEAGHVLVAVSLGLGVVEAKLNSFAPGVLTERRVVPATDRAAFYLSGFFSEHKFDPIGTDIKNSDQDFEQAVALLGDNSSLLSRVAPLMRRASAIVHANFRFVELLAHELQRTGHLSRERIMRLVG
jgi:hypothetical protein